MCFASPTVHGLEISRPDTSQTDHTRDLAFGTKTKTKVKDLASCSRPRLTYLSSRLTSVTKTTRHSPLSARHPVTCLGDWRQLSDVSFQQHDISPARSTEGEGHVTVFCRLCYTDVEYETTTAQAGDVKLVTASWRGSCLVLRQSAATSHMSNHQLTLARWSTRCRRRTVDDHGGRRRCQEDLPSHWCQWLRRVDWTCPCCTDGLWRTNDRQHTWRCLEMSLHALHLRHTACTYQYVMTVSEKASSSFYDI